MLYKTNDFLIKNLGKYLLVMLLTLVIGDRVLHVSRLGLYFPFNYQGDATLKLTWIKSIIDTGWNVINPFIGAENGYNLSDFPQADSFHLLMIKFLALFTHNPALILNLFFLGTFITAACSALFVFNRLGLKGFLAITACLLFTFLPYHFQRNEAHLMLSSYFIIPLIIWLAVQIVPKNLSTPRGMTDSTIKKISGWLLLFLLCLIIGSTGAYYAFFALFFISLAGLIASINQLSWQPLVKGFIFCLLIACSLATNTLPHHFYQKQFGPNVEVAQRSPQEAEISGLKIVQLLLPIDADRWKKLAAFKQRYNETAPLINENNSASLGIIGSTGLLVLLAWVFFRRKAVNADVGSLSLDLMSKLTLCALLLAIIGGFGSLLAYTYFPEVRAYNRISIFIGFMALFAFFYGIQYLTRRWNYSWLMAAISFCLLGVGLYNQTSPANSLTILAKQYQNEYTSDQLFVAQIEKAMPKDSLIFQLPALGFPEYPHPFKMAEYDQFKPYLHSHQIKWSFGALKGRPVFTWQRDTAALPLPDLLKNLAYAGYSGLYINRNGYADQGKALETELTQLLKEQPLVSTNQQLSFFNLNAFIAELKQSQTAVEWQNQVAAAKQALHLQITWSYGFYPLENGNQRWGERKSALEITNDSTKNATLHLQFKLFTNYATPSNLVITGDLIQQMLKVNNEGTDFSTDLTITPGRHTLYFIAAGEPANLPNDPRPVYFKVSNAIVIPQVLIAGSRNSHDL